MRRFLLTCALFISAYFGHASHLVGDDFSYKFIDSSGGIYHYRVTLTLYQDCLYGIPGVIAQDNPAFFAVYTGADSLFKADSAVYSSTFTLPLSNNCGGDTSIRACTMAKMFVKDFYLPESATGYNIVYQRCCPNTVVNILDPTDIGITAICKIPPAGIATHNSSAVFANTPPNVILINEPFAFDFSAIDSDGDSLTYSFCSPLGFSGANAKPWPPGPPPYDSMIYTATYSYDTPMSCSVPIAINPVTGMLTGTPNLIGKYFITVCCFEWRNGVQINSTQREFEFTVINCRLATQPLSAQKTGIQLVPNPNRGMFTVTGNNNDETILLKVTNTFGQQLYNTVLAPQKGGINLQVDLRSNLPAGIYFLHVISESKNQTIRFIIEK